MTNTFKYLKWAILILLLVCAYGLIKQNRIIEQQRLAVKHIDTTEVDTLSILLSPQELTQMLRKRTVPNKLAVVKSQIPYADLFKKYAAEIGWDWELLAALCYSESKFNPQAKSKSGAMGLMQLMPKVIDKFEVVDPYDPEENIQASTRYLKALLELYSFVPQKKEKVKFVLASYNAGSAHIMDARRLAKKYGTDPNVWYEQVEYWLYCLQDSTIAADSVVKFGRFRPIQTLLYVHKVLRYSDKFHNAPEFEVDSLGNVIEYADALTDSITSDEPMFADSIDVDTLTKDSLVERLLEEIIIESDTTD